MLVKQYFPSINDVQKEQFEQLKPLYRFWNAQINVISRKESEMENFEIHHVLHSLSIAKVIDFKVKTSLLDVGTGGGFPGIPLAILYPDCHFHLVDSIGKKIKVAKSIAEALKLHNVTFSNSRAEDINSQYDFVISRAVTRMNKFIPWVQHKFNTENKNTLKNGILYLKGGDLTTELNEVKKHYKLHVYNLVDTISIPFFETKKLVYIPMV